MIHHEIDYGWSAYFVTRSHDVEMRDESSDNSSDPEANDEEIANTPQLVELRYFNFDTNPFSEDYF